MLIVADNLHIIDPAIAAAVEALDPEPIRERVRMCVEAGAQAIDINSGPLPRKAGERFAFLVETVQAAADLPLLLDTTNPRALEAGLAVCRRKAVINGFSPEPIKCETILPLAQQYDADIIGYLLTAESRVPIEEDEIMAVAVDLFEQFSRTGLPAQRLIIDPVIAPVSWQDGMRHNRGGPVGPAHPWRVARRPGAHHCGAFQPGHRAGIRGAQNSP